MAKQKTEKIISFIFWVIGAAMLITSMLTDLWISAFPLKFGLFNYCAPGEEVCKNLLWLYPTQSTVFLNIFIPRVLLLGGAGLIALGLLIGILGLCNNASCPVRTEGVLDMLGGLTIVLGCTIFTARNFDAVNLTTLIRDLGIPGFVFANGQHFHLSFYFGWVSGLMFIIAGVCGVIAGRRHY